MSIFRLALVVFAGVALLAVDWLPAPARPPRPLDGRSILPFARNLGLGSLRPRFTTPAATACTGDGFDLSRCRGRQCDKWASASVR